jgi:ribosome-binding ATPase YchF (GTP1/OBG family)
VIILAQDGNRDIGHVEHGKIMSKIIITEKQFKEVVKTIKEEQQEGSYMAKQQLFTIATLAYKMWELMEEGEQLEDWMESKIAQSEQSITSVVKSFMYDELEDRAKGPHGFDPNELIIGK